MPARRIVFGHVFEGLLLHGLTEAERTPALCAELAARGVELNRLHPEYPLEVWMECLLFLAGALYPGQPRAWALEQLGERMTTGYAKTLMGRALFALLRLLGPEAALSRANQSFRSADNYTHAELRRTGPSDVELRINGPQPLHPYGVGVLRAGMAQVGARSPCVDILVTEEDSATYRICWAGSAAVSGRRP